MTIAETICAYGAAFADDPKTEINRILRKYCDDVDAGREPSTLHDINGNTVGTVDTWED